MPASNPRLISHSSPHETALQKAMKKVFTLIKKVGEFAGHSISLAMFLAMGWVISQTFIFEFLGPAIKEFFFNATSLLPPALAPWSTWLILGGVGCILGGQILYAALTGTLFDSHNPQRQYGSWLYAVLGWIAPAITFAYLYSHGAALGSTLLWTAIGGGVAGTLISPLVLKLDVYSREYEKAFKEIIKFVGKASLQGIKNLYQKGNDWVLPFIDQGFAWLKDTFNRLIPEETPPATPQPIDPPSATYQGGDPLMPLPAAPIAALPVGINPDPSPEEHAEVVRLRP